MTKLTMTRRSFNRTALASALLAIAAVPRDGEAAAEEGASSKRSTIRDVIKQILPGDPPREITLVKVTYPPGTGSPPHFTPKRSHGVRGRGSNRIQSGGSTRAGLS